MLLVNFAENTSKGKTYVELRMNDYGYNNRFS